MKKDILICFWNIRTLYQTGKLTQLAAEAHRYVLDILGLREVRWNEFGEIRTQAKQTTLLRTTK